MFFARRAFAQTKNIACFVFVFLFFVPGVLCTRSKKMFVWWSANWKAMQWFCYEVSRQIANVTLWRVVSLVSE